MQVHEKIIINALYLPFLPFLLKYKYEKNNNKEKLLRIKV